MYPTDRQTIDQLALEILWWCAVRRTVGQRCGQWLLSKKPVVMWRKWRRCWLIANVDSLLKVPSFSALLVLSTHYMPWRFEWRTNWGHIPYTNIFNCHAILWPYSLFVDSSALSCWPQMPAMEFVDCKMPDLQSHVHIFHARTIQLQYSIERTRKNGNILVWRYLAKG